MNNFNGVDCFYSNFALSDIRISMAVGNARSYALWW